MLLYFSNPVLSNSARWQVNVYKQSTSYENVNNFSINTQQANTTLPKVGVEPGTYYIVIKDNSYGDSAGINYSFKADFVATDYWESEFNDSYTSADKMVTEQKYGGHIHDRGRADYYEVSVEKNGYLAITFTNTVVSSSSARWSVTVYRYVNELQEIQFYTASVSTAKTTLPKIGVEPGIYYIKVADDNYGYCCNTEYGIKADYTETPYWETEINDNYSVADKMVTGKEYGGHIHNRGKSDFYELTFEDKGYFTLTFTNPVIQSSSARWEIKIYRFGDSLQQIQSYTVSVDKAKTVLPKIGIEPGTYYIEVRDANYGYACNITYTVKTDFVKNEYYESELNDTYTVADKMVADKKYGGHIHSRGLSDYYELNVTKGGKLKIYFEHEVFQNSSAKWSITVYEYNNELKKISSFISTAANAKTVSDEIFLSPGVYYIQIQDSNYGYGCNIEYSITASQGEDVLPGDVNLDGQITAADARLALRASVGLDKLSSTQLIAAEVDKKDGITASDARLILRASVGLEKL